MKAVQINAYGGNDVLEVNENVPKPVSAKGQVLVEVHAAGINPIDWKVRAGYLKEMVPLQFPATLGTDFSGVVAEAGEGVTDFKVGDEVFGQAGILNGGSGSFAEFAAADVSKIAAKPKSLDFTQAGALPLAGLSALQAIDDHIKLQEGPASAKASAGKQKILIHGGAGGIGHLAIQLAKARGAYVATTVSRDDKDFVLKLGADEAFDYKTEDFEKGIKDFDAVFDASGAEVADRSFTVLKKGGILVSMTQEPDQELAKEKGVVAMRQSTDGNPQRLNRLAQLVDSGKIKVHVDKVFPLEEAKEAFRHLEEGNPQGKVVFKIK